MMLGSILSDGEASRLQSSIVTAGLATEVWAGPGLMGGPLDSRDPDVFVLGALHTPQITANALIELCHREIADIAERGPDPAELHRAVVRFCSGLFRDNDAIGSRTRFIGSLELLHGRPELVHLLPDLISALSTDDIAAAASSLDPQRCAVLEVVPDPVATGATGGSRRDRS